MEHVSNFAGFMDKDSSDEFIPAINYRHLENGDIMYTEGEAGGVLVNVKGNTVLDIEWDPAAPASLPYTQDPTNPYSGYSIVGAATLRDDIILFYASAGGNNIVDILKAKGDGTFRRISVVYEEDLDITLADKVFSETRHENSANLKIYFGTKSLTNTDNIQLSMLNMAPDVIDGVISDALLQASYTRYATMPTEGIGAIGLIPPSTAISGFEIVIGNLPNGAYSYSYRKINEGGNKTQWSTLSPIVYLSPESMDQDSVALTGGKTSGTYDETNSSKGFKFEIDDDGVYSHVEIARIYYTSNSNTPTANIIKRVPSTNSTLYITDTNRETVIGTVDALEFSLPAIVQTPKTMTPKDDILFTGNIKDTVFDVDFDARAYAFDSSQEAKLYTEADVLENTLDGTSGTWEATALAYDETLDCVNRTNSIDNDFTAADNGYKFQSDGVTRGAEGPNVTISFTDDTVPVADMGAGWNSYKATIDADGWIRGEKKLFQKDEIYRVGVVFFDDFGRRSPVKWMCDLRMPSYYELADSGTHGTTEQYWALTDADVAIPTFDIVTTGTDAAGLDFQIVYVKRDYADRTVITEGLGTTVRKNTYTDWMEYTPSVGLNPFYGTGATTQSYGINDCGGFRDKVVSGTDAPEYFGLETPEAMFNKNLSLSGKRADLIGYMTAGSLTLTGSQNLWGLIVASSYATVYHYWRVHDIDMLTKSSSNSYTIDDDALIRSESSGNIGGINIEGRAAYSQTSNSYRIGDACTKHYIYLDGFVNPAGVDEYDIPFFKIRQSTVQYGGKGYNARVKNDYIAASSINTSGATSVKAYYGDTFLAQFEYQRTQYPLTDRDDDDDTSTAPYWVKAAETVAIPVESSINLNLRYDDTAISLSQGAADGLVTAMQVREEGLGAITEVTTYATAYALVEYIAAATEVEYSPLYLYNSVYSRLQDTESFVSLASDYLREDKVDTMVRVSDLKTNGEFYDGWLNFKPLNYKDADTQHGAINFMDTFNDEVFIWQDTGFSHALVNPRVQTQGSDGVEMILGTGDTLHDIDYLSTDIGIQGINEAILSFSGMYWLDNNKKKIYRYGGGIESISDTKNMSSYLDMTIQKDSIFLGVYDVQRDKVFMSVRNEISGVLDLDTMTVSVSGEPDLTLSGDTSRIEMVEGLSYELVDITGVSGEYTLENINATTLVFTRTSGTLLTFGRLVDMTLYTKYKDSYTLAYDEPTSTFRSFESFIPSLAIRGADNFYTTEDDSTLYVHNEGDRGSFYGTVYPMIVDPVINTGRNMNKQFGGVKFINTVFNSVRGTEDELDYTGTENKTLSAVRLISDRQQTPYLDLYTKDSAIITELVGGLSTGNIDASNYEINGGSDRVIRDTNGLRIIPYPAHLYNVRHTLNEFRASLPRVDTGMIDAVNDNKHITELLRGNQATLRLVYDNSDNDLLKLKSVTTYFNTSIDA